MAPKRRPAAAPAEASRAVRARPAASEAQLALPQAEAPAPENLVIGDAEAGDVTGPRELRGARAGQPRRQYCWWITFPFPYDATVARLQLKTPAEVK